MVKDRLKQALLATGTLDLISRTRPPGVVVLMYHSVMDDPKQEQYRLGEIVHSTETFANQMELLARHYSPASMDDVVNFLQDGKQLPRRCVCVTFDDGYADNLEIVAPILSRYGICATIYVTVTSVETAALPWPARLRNAFLTSRRDSWTDPSGEQWRLGALGDRNGAFRAASELCARLCGAKQEQFVSSIECDLEVAPPITNLMMNWDQVRKVHRQGHIVGSHTLTHPNIAYLGEDEMRREMADSKRKVEQELSSPVIHFAYPGPALKPIWSERSVQFSREIGYQSAVTTTGGPVRKGDDPLCLRRVGAPKDVRELRWVLERTFAGV